MWYPLPDFLTGLRTPARSWKSPQLSEWQHVTSLSIIDLLSNYIIRSESQLPEQFPRGGHTGKVSRDRMHTGFQKSKENRGPQNTYTNCDAQFAPRPEGSNDEACLPHSCLCWLWDVHLQHGDSLCLHNSPTPYKVASNVWGWGGTWYKKVYRSSTLNRPINLPCRLFF